MKLQTKLLISFLLIGMIPFAIMAGVSLWKSNQALSTAAYDQLTELREIKKSQVENYFSERKGDMGVLAETAGQFRLDALHNLEAIKNNKKIALELLIEQWFVDIKAQQDRSICTKGLQHFKNFLETGEQSPEYKRFATIIDGFVKATDYDDFFVIDLDGLVVHTQAQQTDYKTNIKSGPYHNSGLGRAFAKAAQGEVNFVDFSPYEPSYLEPTAFLAAPILSNGQQTGVVALQISIEKLQTIMNERTGLGKTGEAYLVGPDKLMRSDSFLDSTNHSVGASFANPDKGRADTEAVNKALNGKDGSDVIIDYNGSPVLSSYAPLKVDQTTWAIITEITVAEVFSPIDEQGHEYYAKYIKEYGYYDLFLLNPDGYCFYTVTREADYQTNLVNGKFSGSSLGQAVKKSIESKSMTFGDFAPYAPSNNDPCAFIVEPILHDGKIEILVALQLSTDAINQMVVTGSNKERTLESYLVGPDHLMRSDSILNPDGYSVKASFANNNKVKTKATEEALAGQSDARIIKDYLGSSVLSAFAPVEIFGQKWALICEIDEGVAFAAVKTMRNLALVIAIVGLIIIILVALRIAGSVAKPIMRIVENLASGADQVAAAAGQVSSASQSLAEGSSEQAASLEETSSSVEEMSSMTKQNADNSDQADRLTQETVNAVQSASTSITTLSNATEEIYSASQETQKIVKSIDEIAFQTNLLALNAAVEAARAGEAGAGFAVVADEVRNLAARSAEAAKSTAELIGSTVDKVSSSRDIAAKSLTAVSEVVEKSGKVGELVSEISAASQEQSNGIGQINIAVSEMDKVTQQNAANAEESAAAAEELNAQAEQMRDFVSDLSTMITGVREPHANISQVQHLTSKRAAPKKQKALSHRQTTPKSATDPKTIIPFDDDKGSTDDFEGF